MIERFLSHVGSADQVFLDPGLFGKLFHILILLNGVSDLVDKRKDLIYKPGFPFGSGEINALFHLDYLEIDEILDFLRTKGSEDLLSEPLRQSINGIEMFFKKPYPPKDYENKFYADVEFFKRTHPTVLRNVERIMKMGGTIGVGTDCCGTGMSFFGHYWKELKWLTSAGFTNAGALKAATAVNAAIIGMADSIGTIEPAKYADFTIIEGDPLENVENVKNVKMVVKGGNVIYNNL